MQTKIKLKGVFISDFLKKLNFSSIPFFPMELISSLPTAGHFAFMWRFCGNFFKAQRRRPFKSFYWRLIHKLRPKLPRIGDKNTQLCLNCEVLFVFLNRHCDAIKKTLRKYNVKRSFSLRKVKIYTF